MNKLEKIVFASQCIFCGSIFNDFCIKCLQKCFFSEIDRCIVCNKYSFKGITHKMCMYSSFPTISYTVYSYKGIVKSCILKAKYRRKEFAALKDMVEYGIFYLNRDLIDLKGFIVLPMPLDKKELKVRGYNEADVISKVVCEVLNLGYISNFRRDKDRGVFDVHSSFEDLKVLIVDDVYDRRGMLDLSKTLYNAGASEVRCFALCVKR